MTRRRHSIRHWMVGMFMAEGLSKRGAERLLASRTDEEIELNSTSPSEIRAYLRYLVDLDNT